MYIDDKFWKYDYAILYNRNRLVEFVPTKDMTVNEKLNALTRLAIYASVLLILYFQNIEYIYIALITMIIIYMIHSNHPQHGGDNQVKPCPLQAPSKNNPFMNVLMTDYADHPQRKPAADVEDGRVKAEMETNFSNGLYRNSDDIWDRSNSQRQYYTNPSTTIPNDVDTFMKWCYNTPYTCKDNNLENCGRYNPNNVL